MTNNQPQKIAVLGGGMGSLATVFELTSQPDWSAKYDITVYQLGWRLGGKGASGRDITPDPQRPDGEPNYKIEEHGLHIFFGFYENAFRMMKQCYEELTKDTPTDRAFTSVEDAFKPHNLIVLEDYANGKWHDWVMNFPPNDLKPWESNSDPASMWDHVVAALKLTYDVWSQSDVLGGSAASKRCSPESLVQQVWQNFEAFGLAAGAAFISGSNRLVDSLVNAPQQWLDRGMDLFGRLGQVAQALDVGSEGIFLSLAYQLAQNLPIDPKHHWQEHHGALVKLLDQFQDRLEQTWHQLVASELQEDEKSRRDLLIINFGLSSIRAVLAEGLLLTTSLDELDRYEYTEWLKQYGLWEETAQSPMVRSVYDLVYGYAEGDIRKPRLAAGVALRVVINIYFRYNGAIMWKMQAGMGDVIFAPLYEVLERRGVKFKFFQRVTGLHLNAEQSAIERISVNRQVTLKDEEKGYAPLFPVKRVVSWPNQPFYDQIDPAQAEELKAQNIDLESFWTPWQEKEQPYALERGKDFDLVILGISLAALPYIAQELLNASQTPTAQAASQKWRDMVTQVKTVTTQGGQLWLKPNLGQMGWPRSLPEPVVGTYVEPLDTYADMTHLVEKENWPENNYPYHLAYFTGVMLDPGIPDAKDYGFPAQQKALNDQRVEQFLNNDIGPLWPNATKPDHPEGLDESLVISRFWRINIYPTERYVLSLPNSTQYRLKADESGFENLFLTGDWIRNGFNAGAIEPTVISGLQTARAVLKAGFDLPYRQEILGERTGWI
jgi:uncharacterized protein with NAD-binding domain and iron-sulfur cluster